MRIYSFVVLLLSSAGLVSCSPRKKRASPDLSPGNWDSCKPGAKAPSTRVNTRDLVSVLRQYFATQGIEAYLVPSEDAHLSEYVSDHDKRRAYISGFDGSAGFAVITINKQALWTDGRYFLEAESTLDCNWILMRQKEEGVPTMTEWLKQELNASQSLGASPYLVSSAAWTRYEEELRQAGIRMKTSIDLIDLFWKKGNGRPAMPSTRINTLPLRFSGVRWQDKVADMREKMKAKDTSMMVVTKLDETAWLFNLRASDISYNPFFISYAIVEMDRIRLYLLDPVEKLSAEPDMVDSEVTVADHLNTNENGTCIGRKGLCVEVLEYDSNDVVTDVNAGAAETPSRVWLSFSCNYAIYNTITKAKIYQANTPIATTKTLKNPTEVEGMKNSHIRDAVAVVSFMAYLEKEVKEGANWTELTAANLLYSYRAKERYNRGESFAAISSYGPNGAIIHYRPSEATDTTIGTDSLYLLDSGGQYLDGTTDVTRTFHFGTPTAYMKECYTRVLMGHIDLFNAIWPRGLYGREIDGFARRPLWDVGLTYRHGTGHGIGMYLSVHEGPGRISLTHDLFQEDIPLDVNQFFSDEPGYYEDGEFGIRLENIVRVVNASTKYDFPGVQFLTFEHVTLVPYEPKLIDFSLLDEEQIEYLNNYNALCRSKVGPKLKEVDETAGYEWLMQKTEPIIIPESAKTSGTHPLHVNVFIILSLLMTIFLS